MWRVKNDHSESIVGIRHTGEVSDYIRLYFERATITKCCVNLTNILKQHSCVMLIKVKHLATAASVQYWFFHSLMRYVGFHV